MLLYYHKYMFGVWTFGCNDIFIHVCNVCFFITRTHILVLCHCALVSYLLKEMSKSVSCPLPLLLSWSVRWSD